MKTQICKECGGISKPSKALLDQLLSFDDFGNDTGKRGTTQSRLGSSEEVDCLKCSNCGHSWVPKKSNREEAIEWFSQFSSMGKTQLCDTNTQLVGNIRRWETLTGREIECLWLQEKALEVGSQIHKEFENKIKEQVDFEKVGEFIELLKDSHNNWISAKATNNMINFFELLAKSSTFAHKAHKELNKSHL